MADSSNVSSTQHTSSTQSAGTSTTADGASITFAADVRHPEGSVVHPDFLIITERQPSIKEQLAVYTEKRLSRKQQWNQQQQNDDAHNNVIALDSTTHDDNRSKATI